MKSHSASRRDPMVVTAIGLLHIEDCQYPLFYWSVIARNQMGSRTICRTTEIREPELTARLVREVRVDDEVLITVASTSDRGCDEDDVHLTGFQVRARAHDRVTSDAHARLPILFWGSPSKRLNVGPEMLN